MFKEYLSFFKTLAFMTLIVFLSMCLASCNTKTLNYPDGRIKYEGGWKNNLENGKGKYYSKNGKIIYEGKWLDGKYHGKGKYYNENGELIYDGNWSEDKYCGEGKLFLDDNIFYEGSFEKGEMNGQGKIYASGNLKYDGRFSNGELLEGKEYDVNNQVVYDGGFYNFKYNGDGELYYDNKLIYSGEFIDGQAKEEAELFIQRNELTGSGHYEPKVVSGYILYSYENGKKNNKINFFDEYDHLVYEGQIVYRNDSPVIEGYGVAYFYHFVYEKFYKVYEGNWKDGLWHGKGKSFWDTGEVLYSTNYKNGYRHGRYIRYYSDGELNDKGVSEEGKNIKSDVYDYD